MRRSYFALSALMLMVVIAACGGGTAADSTTTVATTVPTTVEESPTGTVSDLSDMPQECLDAFRTFLQELEPLIEGHDFNEMSMEDMEALVEEIEPISAPLEEQTANCPDLDLSAEESLTAMREFAESEAPGTVAYFVWLEEFLEGMENGGATASGDCETDLAALDVYVAQGGTMNDLTMGELSAVGALMTAVSTECAPERFQEWVSQEEVAAWMGTP